jgi:hypothetical protein
MQKCGKNIVESDRPEMTIWRMRFLCWVTKATTHGGPQLLGESQLADSESPPDMVVSCE